MNQARLILNLFLRGQAREIEAVLAPHVVKRRRAGGFIFGGVALAALASEYPEDFREIRANLPLYLERGATLLTVASRIGERLATVSESRNSAWDEELV